jgi:hypothetical protein
VLLLVLLVTFVFDFLQLALLVNFVAWGNASVLLGAARVRVGAGHGLALGGITCHVLLGRVAGLLGRIALWRVSRLGRVAWLLRGVTLRWVSRLLGRVGVLLLRLRARLLGWVALLRGITGLLGRVGVLLLGRVARLLGRIARLLGGVAWRWGTPVWHLLLLWLLWVLLGRCLS